MQRKSIVTGALILTSANIITRILGFIYRIYMSNTIGAEGMGLYQLIMPIYGLAWSISSSGFSTTISKLTSQENAKKEYGNMGRILKQCLVITGGLGIVLSIALFFFSDFIATNVFHDARTLLSLKILSVCFPFMAAGSCIRGYFFGLQESAIPAISQIFEQSVRMCIIYVFGAMFIPRGLEYACAVAVIGICVGEVLSFLFVICSYKIFKSKNKLVHKPSMSPLTSLWIIACMAAPLTANRVTGSLLGTVENILIPQRLLLSGMDVSKSMSTFGQLSGMAMPLLMFPSAFLVALSISLVPAVSEASAIKNDKKISITISKSLLFTCVCGIASSAIFILFSQEISVAIYSKNNIGVSDILFLMGFMCPFLYLQITMSGILNGLSQQVFIFKNSLLSSVINLGFIYFLIPIYGINAFILGWFVSLIALCILCVRKITACAKIDFDFSNWVFKPIIAAVACGLSLRILYNFVFKAILSNVISLVLTLLLFGIFYFILLIVLGCISKEDLKILKRKKAR